MREGETWAEDRKFGRLEVRKLGRWEDGKFGPKDSPKEYFVPSEKLGTEELWCIRVEV